eukprot:scaffold186478_cov46-Prasinocladus_malaysianus.AAC.3
MACPTALFTLFDHSGAEALGASQGDKRRRGLEQILSWLSWLRPQHWRSFIGNEENSNGNTDDPAATSGSWKDAQLRQAELLKQEEEEREAQRQ